MCIRDRGSAATPSALAFGNAANMSAAGVTLNVSTTEDGAAGPQVVVQQSLLLSAVTLTVANAGTSTEAFTSAAWDVGANANTGGGANQTLLNTALTLADDNPGADNLLSLDNITAGFFTQALQNVATLRANNGGQVRHLQYAHANACLLYTSDAADDTP